MIEIKEISLNEIENISNLVPEFKGETNKKFEKRLNGKKSYMFGAYYNKEKAGYSICYKENESDFYIWRSGTVPKYRRRGINTKLMDYIEKLAKEEGYQKIKIKTKNNRRAQLFNLVKRNYMFVSIEKRETIEENKIDLEKKI